MTITLPHNFEAREYQKNFFIAMNEGKKRAVLVWNRRAGKDTSSLNYLIMTAMEVKGIYYYVFPTFSQGRKVIWDGMTNTGYKFIDYIPKRIIKHINNHEMKVTLINGSLIQIVGSDNYDAIMGTNPSGCIFSEYSMQNPNAWQFIRPILDANDGWAIFVFTPRGSNHAKDLYDMALHNDKWFCELLTNNDTQILSAEKLADLRKEGMTEDMVQQEWFCSFTQGIMGSYYSKYVAELYDNNQIGNVPWDRTQQVHSSWDLGVGDSTFITFFQCCGNEIHIIDMYQNQGEGLPHYAKIIKDKPYNYGYHFAPHDIKAREFGTGNSRQSVARDLGLDFTVLNTLSIKWSLEEGIECVRGMLPRFWIDVVKCDYIIKTLENYRKEYDEINKIYKNKPKHDHWSHAADSIRYACIGIKDHLQAAKGPTYEEVEYMRDQLQRFT